MSGSLDRYRLAEAKFKAELFIDQELARYVDRVMIVGSVRRAKADVGDIEILYTPKFGPGQPDLFGDGPDMVNLAFERLSELRSAGALILRLDKDDRSAFGERYQRVTWRGCRFDLFACFAPAHWGVLQLIRTGPAEFSHRMVTPKPYGFLPMGMQVKDGQLVDRGTVLDVPDEEAWFRHVGMDYIEPRDRSGE